MADSLRVFESMEKNVSTRAVNAETLQLLFDITQKKLEIMRLLRQYGYQIEQVEERANESTVTLSFTEQKDDIDLIPENTKANFMAQMRDAIHQIVRIGIEILTMPLVILAQAIKLVIYGAIILAVLAVAYRIGKKLFPKIYERIL